MDAEVIGSQLTEEIVTPALEIAHPVHQKEDVCASDALFKEKFKDKQLIFIDNLRATSIYLESEGEGSSDALTSRLNKEVKVLSRGLPCDVASSIFVAVDSDQLRFMTGVIAGSEGTPYAHGLFFFDIFCGISYPNSPPQFTLKTTGGGEAYFGPNLYSSGYVCLSIINTWSGDPEEMWNANKNILQVLLSIQALVMDNYILQKEPGWEFIDANCTDSVLYQNAVKYLNIKFAMTNNMRNPPEGFSDLINTYFKIKRDYILKEVNTWLIKAKTEVIDYTIHDSMAFYYNPALCQRMVNEGFHKVLSEVALELKTELESRYGASEIELDLYTGAEEPGESEETKLESENTELIKEAEPEITPQPPAPLSPSIHILEAAELPDPLQMSIDSIVEAEVAAPPQLFENEEALQVYDQISPEFEEGIEPVPAPILFREPSASDPEAPDSTHLYFQELGSLRLQLLDESEGYFSNFMFERTPIDDHGLNRFNKEIKALTRSLPCEPSGSVFVAVNASNMSVIQVIIAGTEDTPYEHGMFLFDLKLPQDYPNNPPNMNIKTTGGGILRFNPNLYDSGYVCLSIINTWGGDPEEMWNPTYSTLLQVFLSIQALVMDNNVIQKEPGYESYTTDSAANMQYRAIVTYGNIKYAMTDMIRNPPAEFKEIIHKHFLIKRDKIIETVGKWRAEAVQIELPFTNEIVLAHNPTTVQEFSSNGVAQCFDTAIEELKNELLTLK